MASEAEIIPAVLNSSGAVLDRADPRIATRTQTLALIGRDVGAASRDVRTRRSGANVTTSENGPTAD